VTSSIGCFVALLVVEKRNQATSPAATTALIVIKTVTIGGIPPRLLAVIKGMMNLVFITLSLALEGRRKKKKELGLFTVYGLATAKLVW
jgi:hypothetical protein